MSKANDFAADPELKDLFIEANKTALMNASMMSLKMKNYQEALEMLKYVRSFFLPTDDMSKLNYRMGACYNGLKMYKEAIDVLEPMKYSKDPLVKIEYNKAVNELKKEMVVTEQQKSTYAKMFNPDTRKEEETKRKEEKKTKSEVEEKQGKDNEDKQDKDTDNGDSFTKYLKYVFGIALVGAVAYSVIKRGSH
jgi:tetratricopeptide (TPR) repeat protein